MVGPRDRNADQCKLAADDFEAAGYPVKMRIYPRAAHTFPLENDAELRKALQFIMQG